MEINTNLPAAGVTNLTPAKQRSPAAAPTADSGASFASTNALNVALKQVPDVRSDAVDRARDLINDPNYPSADTIKKLSSFLAGKLQSNPD
jgi:hypothetical protein